MNSLKILTINGSRMTKSLRIFSGKTWKKMAVNFKRVQQSVIAWQCPSMPFTENHNWTLTNFHLVKQELLAQTKVIMQGNLFQRCTHLLYCSVLSLGGNVNIRRMSQPDMGSIFHIKNQWNILVIGNYYVNYQSYQN